MMLITDEARALAALSGCTGDAVLIPQARAIQAALDKARAEEQSTRAEGRTEVLQSIHAAGSRLLGHCEGCGDWTEPGPTLGNGHDNGQMEACGPMTEWRLEPPPDEALDKARAEGIHAAAALLTRLKQEAETAYDQGRAEERRRWETARAECIATEREIRDDHWRRVVAALEHRLEVATHEERRRCAEIARKHTGCDCWECQLVRENTRCCDVIADAIEQEGADDAKA